LIGHYFPDLPENKKEDQILRWVPPVGKDAPVTASPGGFYVSYLGDVLQKLHTEEDGKDFQQLKDVVDDYKRQPFILSRVGMSRNRAAHWTPKPIKDLNPQILRWCGNGLLQHSKGITVLPHASEIG